MKESLSLCSCVLLLSQKLSLLELHHAVQSLRGSEVRLASQKALLDAKMATAASPPPPPPPPALPYEDDTRSVGSTVKTTVGWCWFSSDLLWECVCVSVRWCVCVCVQDKTKEKSSRFETLRHSLAGMIRSPKTMLGSSTSVSVVIKFPQSVVTSSLK